MDDNRELTPDEALLLFTAANQVPRHPAGPHLDDEDLLGLAEDSLTDSRLADAMRHLESCSTCAEAAARTMDAVGAGRRPSAVQTPAVRTPIRPAGTAAVPRTERRAWVRHPGRASWMGIAAALLLTLSGGWYAGMEWRRAAAETAGVRRTLADRESRITALETLLAESTSRETAAGIVANFSLRTSDATRADDGTDTIQSLPVPPGAAFVTFLVDLGPLPASPGGSYEVVVTNPDRPQEWRSVVRPEMRDGRYVVAATAPRSIVPDGDYLLVVNAVPASGEPREVASATFSLVSQRHSP